MQDNIVTPAKAGVQENHTRQFKIAWIPRLRGNDEKSIVSADYFSKPISRMYFCTPG